MSRFGGRTDRYWRNKARLYLVLHGLNINEFDACMNICKHKQKIPDDVFGKGFYRCGLIYNNKSRWMIKRDFSKIQKEPIPLKEDYYCIEWIKDV